nr:cucumisin [Quercus suber]
MKTLNLLMDLGTSTHCNQITDFLCVQGYNTTTLRLIIGDNSNFCNTTKPGRAWNLNYPSFSVAVEDGQQIKAFTRTVTNVGPPNSTYTL